VLVESDPDEAQVFESCEHVFLASEERPVLAALADRHIFSLLIDFLQ
jgi:hypothetical protein